MLRVALGFAAFLALPAAAQAGTFSSSPLVSVTYSALAGENVTVGTDTSTSFLTTDQSLTPGSMLMCTPSAKRADCQFIPTRFIVNLNGANSSVDGTQVTRVALLEAHGGVGNDQINGTPNGDQISGDAGVDTLNGGDGPDTIDAGPGGGEIDDGPGDDLITGGSGNDNWTAGAGRDTFVPGDGSDSVSYGGRSNPVTITLDGVADDGEAGEGDNAGQAEDATGGAGNDRIVGNDLGDRLHGGAGDDSIVGGKAEDRLEGDEGNDTIDARDGRFDSVDCGPGSDVVYADPGDSTEGCEVAPDRDGDGTLNEQDCAPDNAAIHPGAGEIVGNDVDEDCKGGPQYLRVVSPVSYSTSRKGNQVKFTKFTVGELKKGDKVQIRCTTKSKGCPFSTKTITAKAGKRTVTVLSYFKKRYLKKGAVVEVRTTRPNEIGAVRRLTVVKNGNIKLQLLCLAPGATKPSRCV